MSARRGYRFPAAAHLRVRSATEDNLAVFLAKGASLERLPLTLYPSTQRATLQTVGETPSLLSCSSSTSSASKPAVCDVKRVVRAAQRTRPKTSAESILEYLKTRRATPPGGGNVSQPPGGSTQAGDGAARRRHCAYPRLSLSSSRCQCRRCRDDLKASLNLSSALSSHSGSDNDQPVSGTGDYDYDDDDGDDDDDDDKSSLSSSDCAVSPLSDVAYLKSRRLAALRF